MSRFLLEESNIVWFPNHIYQDLEKNDFYFIYIPYCRQETGFHELLEYLIEHIDYQDEEMVEYLYKAYEQYETAGEVYLQQKIYEDAECLRISGIDPTEHTKEEMIQQKTEDILPAEEKIENKREENRTTGEKKSLFALWENRKKKEKQERENYSRNLQLTMNGYAVAEETAYEEEDMGRTVYMGEQSAMREIKHRLLTEEGSLIATLDQEAYDNRQEKGRGGSGTGGSVDQQTSCQNCKRRRRILSGRYEFYEWNFQKRTAHAAL